MAKRKFKCAVFMPFDKEFNPVYDAIQKAVGDLRRESREEIKAERVDETAHRRDRDQVRAIKTTIRDCDLAIFDVTREKASVMWELGYAEALLKDFILLSQSTKLPFPIRVQQAHQYTSSAEGLTDLADMVARIIGQKLPGIRARRSKLLFHPDITHYGREVQRGLREIDQLSLRSRLAKNEFGRLAERVARIGDGHFELRNEKPNEEIIEYFCDYISQLDSDLCSFDAITHYDFWREITGDNHSFGFVQANVAAAEAGARIRRVFILDKAECPDDQVGNQLLEDVLKQLFEAGQRLRNIETKLYFSDAYIRDIQTYGNFGILNKESELLLAMPLYEGEHMEKTEFFYSSEHGRSTSASSDNSRRINDKQALFKNLWRDSIILDKAHFYH